MKGDRSRAMLENGSAPDNPDKFIQLKKQRPLWLGFAAALAASLILVVGLSVWQISSSMQTFQQQSAVDGLNRQSAMATMLQGLSRLLVGLDGIRVDPSSAKLSQTAEALDLARDSVKKYSTLYLNAESDIVREQIIDLNNIIVGTSRLLHENDPPPGDVLSLRTQLGDTVKDLTDEYLHSNEKLLQVLNVEVQQIGRLRERLFEMVLIIAIGFIGIIALSIAQARARAREAAALNALGERERRYRDLIDGSHQGIIILDGDKPLLANQASAAILGYKNADEILALDSFYAVIVPEERIKILDYRKSVEKIQSGTFDNEFLVQKIGGSKFWCSIHFREVLWGGKKVTQVFMVDVTDRRTAAEALERARDVANSASRSKSEFLANMSHEIRTPMNAVIGLSHLALKIAKDTTLRDYLSKIDTSARLLLGIINDILDFSKIEAGKLEMEKVSFELNQIIDNLVVLFSNAVESKNLELIIKIPPDLPKKYIGDPLRLSQILINLVSNAIKFTEVGSIIIDVKSNIIDNEVLYLDFTVKDTGIGLSIEQKKRLFQAFSQGDGSTMRRYGGTGLGLTICRRLVELMGGYIRVDSELGAGSVFSFSVRLEQVIENNILDLNDIYDKNILLVGANSHIVDAVNEVFSKYSCKIISINNHEININSIITNEKINFIVYCCNEKFDEKIINIEKIKNNTNLYMKKIIILIPASMDKKQRQKLSLIPDVVILTKPLHIGKLIHGMISNPMLEQSLGSAPEKIMFDSSHLQGADVLLVEDNEINQMVAEGILSAHGIKITIANNGLEAIEFLKRKQFDAVLMDLQMPEMDGYTATRIIRQELDLADLPIIAMTAHALAEERDRCIAAGMDDHVAKPVDPEKLISILSQFIVLKKNHPNKKQTDVYTRINDMPINKQISGIDIEEAMFRIGGNYDLLVNLVDRFKEDYSNIHIKIENLYKEGSLNEVARIVHTLKGVAANLSALTVFETVRLVEAVLLSGANQTNLGPLLITLKQAIDEVGLKPTLPQTDIEELVRVGEYLMPLAEAASRNEASLAVSLRAFVPQIPAGPWLAPIEQAARASDNGDYDTAALSIRVAIRLLDSAAHRETTS